MKFFTGPEGRSAFLKTRGDLPVIIDVLRASSTIVVALARGAAGVIPVEDAGEALALGRKLGALTVGERQGFRIGGFDYGNSPTQMLKLPLEGRTIVMTTTNGTRIMVEGGLVASTLNAGAVARRIKKAPHSYLLASGAPLKSEEDLAAARLIELISDRIGEGLSDTAAKTIAGCPEGRALLDLIRGSGSGEKLAAHGAGPDVALICTAIDAFPVLPFYRNGVITIG